MLTNTLYPTDASNVKPRLSIPSTEQQRTVAGPYVVTLYRRWDSCGGGYDVVTRAGGGEVKRCYSHYYPRAQRLFDDELRRRKAEHAEAMTTMLALVDECSCYDLPDGRAHVCAPCRRRAANTTILF